jgi:hypothetical protein
MADSLRDAFHATPAMTRTRPIGNRKTPMVRMLTTPKLTMAPVAAHHR